MTEIDGKDVVEKYFALLSNPSKTIIRDERELPYPKDVIKVVLKHMLSLVSDAETKDRLKVAYQGLADFQPLTYEERKAVSVMAAVDGKAEPGSEEADKQLRDVAEYGSVAQAVAERMLAEAKLLFEEVEPF